MKNIYDLIIIGGGPAGVAAGIYAARQRIKFLLITKDFGGQIARKAVEIENYPGFKKITGLKLVQKFEAHLKAFRVKTKKDIVSKIKKEEAIFKIITKKGDKLNAKTVIITSGADPRPLEVVGEKKFIGRGVSYCVQCDGPLFSGKTIAVIGGGNAGFEAALALSKWAKKIYIFERSRRLKADMIEQEQIKNLGKIEIKTCADLKEIRGKQFVESVLWEDCDTGKTDSLRVDGVFVEIGSQPANFFVKDLVDFSSRDEIEVNPKTCETKTAGLFAAGDVTDVKYKQIVIAAGEGAKAAISAGIYLQKRDKGENKK